MHAQLLKSLAVLRGAEGTRTDDEGLSLQRDQVRNNILQAWLSDPVSTICRSIVLTDIYFRLLMFTYDLWRFILDCCSFKLAPNRHFFF